MTILEIIQQNVPSGTKITQPMTVLIHTLAGRKTGTSTDGSDWSNQALKITDPGQPDTDDTALWCTVWSAIELGDLKGKCVQLTPGPKGGGIKVSEWNGAKKLEVECKSANLALTADPTGGQPVGQGYQQPAPVQQQAPAQQSFAQPIQQQQPAGFQQPQQVVGNAPIQQQSFAQPIQQQPATPSKADQQAKQLKKCKIQFARHGALFEYAFAQATVNWSHITQMHGTAPPLDLIEKLATGMILMARDANTGPSFGSGARALVNETPPNSAPDINTPLQQTADALIWKHAADAKALANHQPSDQ